MLFDYNRFLNNLDDYLQQEDDENYITTVNRLLVLSIDKEVTIFYEDYPNLCSTLLTTVNNILQNKINCNVDCNLLLSIFLSVIQNFNYYESNCRHLSTQPLIYAILDNVLTQNNPESVELSIDITLSLSPYVDLDKNEKLEKFFHHIFTLPLEDSSKLIAISVNLISQSVSDIIIQYFIPLITKVINHIKAYDSSNEKELSQILIMFRVLLKYEMIYSVYILFYLYIRIIQILFKQLLSF